MPPKQSTPRRRVCFITGSRAEFGLMQTALAAIKAHPRLQLQIIATGMHLSRKHGHSIDEIAAGGHKIDAIVPWQGDDIAANTGNAISKISTALKKLKTDIVLVVGDRVEAFAGATAAHLSTIPVAHVHGGDRALGQIDDSLRHAITKLSHIHFPATTQSAQRIKKLGENPWRIHLTGSPGIDGITQLAASQREIAKEFGPLLPRKFALLVLHPIEANEANEYSRAKKVLSAALQSSFDRIVIIYPNNDPGSGGIISCWRDHASGPRFLLRRDIPRPLFLGLLRDAAVLLGNSSAGIIEAASFATPVIDIGPRQQGRQRCKDVTNVPYRQADISAALHHIVRKNAPNPYGGNGAGKKIAATLASLKINPHLLQKLIAY